MSTHYANLADRELFDRCVSAYARYCAQYGYIFQQPSWPAELDGDVVILENIRGELARYKVESNRIRRTFPHFKNPTGRRLKRVFADGSDRPSSLDKQAA